MKKSSSALPAAQAKAGADAPSSGGFSYLRSRQPLPRRVAPTLPRAVTPAPTSPIDRDKGNVVSNISNKPATTNEVVHAAADDLAELRMRLESLRKQGMGNNATAKTTSSTLAKREAKLVYPPRTTQQEVSKSPSISKNTDVAGAATHANPHDALAAASAGKGNKSSANNDIFDFLQHIKSPSIDARTNTVEETKQLSHAMQFRRVSPPRTTRELRFSESPTATKKHGTVAPNTNNYPPNTTTLKPTKNQPSSVERPPPVATAVLNLRRNPPASGKQPAYETSTRATTQLEEKASTRSYSAVVQFGLALLGLLVVLFATYYSYSHGGNHNQRTH